MSIEWDVNYIAVLVATVVAMVIGAVYYQPQVVGRAWMKTLGKTEEDFKNANQPVLYICAAIFTLLWTTVLAAAIGWADAHSLIDGATIGFLAWIGFAIPIVGVVFMFEGRKLVSQVITGGHYLIALVVQGAILGVWPTGDAPAV